MFTGIIQDIGEIVAIDKKGDWTLTVAANKLPLDRMAIGASVACNGICLTVIAKAIRAAIQGSGVGGNAQQDHGASLAPGTQINLEPALRMGDELGGHLVTGHIDGVARLKDKTREGDSLRCIFEVPHEFGKFIAPKGSITLDGVSLTVNEARDGRFGVNIIPHTQSATTFGALEAGGEVNFEVDLIARYAERLLNQKAA